MLREIFVLGILVPWLVVATTNRFAALLLYLWIALFRPQDWVWVDLDALHISLIAGLMLVVPSFMTGVFPNVSHPLSKGAIVFLVCTLIAQMSALNPDLGFVWID